MLPAMHLYQPASRFCHIPLIFKAQLMHGSLMHNKFQKYSIRGQTYSFSLISRKSCMKNRVNHKLYSILYIFVSPWDKIVQLILSAIMNPHQTNFIKLILKLAQVKTTIIKITSHNFFVR